MYHLYHFQRNSNKNLVTPNNFRTFVVEGSSSGRRRRPEKSVALKQGFGGSNPLPRKF